MKCVQHALNCVQHALKCVQHDSKRVQHDLWVSRTLQLPNMSPDTSAAESGEKAGVCPTHFKKCVSHALKCIEHTWKCVHHALKCVQHALGRVQHLCGRVQHAPYNFRRCLRTRAKRSRVKRRGCVQHALNCVQHALGCVQHAWGRVQHAFEVCSTRFVGLPTRFGGVAHLTAPEYVSRHEPSGVGRKSEGRDRVAVPHGGAQLVARSPKVPTPASATLVSEVSKKARKREQVTIPWN